MAPTERDVYIVIYRKIYHFPMRGLSLTGVQEKLGVMNKGLVYALWDYAAQEADELSFSEGDAITVLRRRDDTETDWWWARLNDREGYIPRNLLGVRTLLICLRKQMWRLFIHTAHVRRESHKKKMRNEKKAY